MIMFFPAHLERTLGFGIWHRTSYYVHFSFFFFFMSVVFCLSKLFSSYDFIWTLSFCRRRRCYGSICHKECISRIELVYSAHHTVLFCFVRLHILYDVLSWHLLFWDVSVFRLAQENKEGA